MDRSHPHKRRSRRLIEARASKILQSANVAPGTTQEASSCAILSLPNEVLLSIKSHLAISWQISLALTCKYLKATIFFRGTLPPLEREDLTEFLSIFATDIPYIYFCFCCNKLRPLNSELGWDGQDHRWTLGYIKNSHWPSNNFRDGFIWLPQNYFIFMGIHDIYFKNLYLVMNRHLYGPSHGIPLQSLEHSASFEEELILNKCQHGSETVCDPGNRILESKLEVRPRKRGAWRTSFRSIPKIIDNKLYIARFLTIVGPLVRWEHVARLIASVEPRICHHLECSAPEQRICRHFNKNTSKPREDRRLIITSRMSSWMSSWEGFDPNNFNPEIGSCLFCSTDYDMSLKQDKNKKEWNFGLSTYHCLGACRSPDDQLWAYFASFPDMFDALRFFNYDANPGSPETSAQLEEMKSRYLKLDRGGARRKWHEAT